MATELTGIVIANYINEIFMAILFILSVVWAKIKTADAKKAVAVYTEIQDATAPASAKGKDITGDEALDILEKVLQLLESMDKKTK